MTASHERLAPRERAVFDFLVTGKSLHEIASATGRAHKTIECQRRTIFLKLGLRTLFELGVYAERHGLVPRAAG